MEGLESQGLRRQRSSRRLRHEAQAKVFERQKGGLETIRRQLGLRPSQICELLKVHPSAWTRWIRSGRAPPHIYQMLDWYIEILKWRGQHQYVEAESSSEKLILTRKEDPSTYVPAPIPPAVVGMPRSLVLKWLAISWIIQLCVLGLGFFYLLRK